MPASWSDKCERMYQKIRSSCEKRGKSAAECKRVAAATVNKRCAGAAEQDDPRRTHPLHAVRGVAVEEAMGCKHAKRFHQLVNMSPAQIRRWSKDPRSKCYSNDATRARLPALARLKAKPVSRWTATDCKFAARVVSFNARMDGGRKRDGCTPGYAISLRNWGRRVCSLPKTCKAR